MKYDTKQPVWRNFIRLNGKMLCGCTVGRMREVRASENQRDWSLSYILSGGGVMKLPDRSYELKPGMICQRIPGMKYRLEFYGGITQKRFYIWLPRDFYLLLKSIESDLPGLPVIDIGIDNDIISKLTMFIEKYGVNGDFTWRSTGELLDLVSLLLHPGRPDRETLDPRIAQAMKLLDNPDNLGLSLKTLSRRVGMGYNNFRKVFAIETGMSPGDYRIERRIDFARQMLGSGMTQQETAEALGYSDVYAFARQFKQRTRTTPGKFVKKI